MFPREKLLANVSRQGEPNWRDKFSSTGHLFVLSWHSNGMTPTDTLTWLNSLPSFVSVIINPCYINITDTLMWRDSLLSFIFLLINRCDIPVTSHSHMVWIFAILCIRFHFILCIINSKIQLSVILVKIFIWNAIDLILIFLPFECHKLLCIQIIFLKFIHNYIQLFITL